MVLAQVVIVSAVSIFFTILFLQSGLDKIIDWKGNVEFHSGHFANSPLKNIAPAMLVMITFLELCCGISSLGGLIWLLIKGDPQISFYACCLAALNFLALFFGQRISKDYKGAATLVPYFIVSLIGMFVTSV